MFSVEWQYSLRPFSFISCEATRLCIALNDSFEEIKKVWCLEVTWLVTAIRYISCCFFQQLITQIQYHLSHLWSSLQNYRYQNIMYSDFQSNRKTSIKIPLAQWKYFVVCYKFLFKTLSKFTLWLDFSNYIIYLCCYIG